MADYGYVFSVALQKRLKEKIYAGIFVKSTENDCISIVIARKSDNVVFKTQIDNFSQKILYGYSTEYAAYEVLAKYRSFIMNKFFIKEDSTH